MEIIGQCLFEYYDRNINKMISTFLGLQNTLEIIPNGAENVSE